VQGERIAKSLEAAGKTRFGSNGKHTFQQAGARKTSMGQIIKKRLVRECCDRRRGEKMQGAADSVTDRKGKGLGTNNSES